MLLKKKFFLLLLVILGFQMSPAFAQTTAQANTENLTLPQTTMQQSLISKGAPPIAIEIAVLAGLAVLPWVVMMLTSYLKIVVVISLLRNALGVQQAPPNQIVNGIALLLTILRDVSYRPCYV